MVAVFVRVKEKEREKAETPRVQGGGFVPAIMRAARDYRGTFALIQPD
jgi:hypothetical protein